MKSIFRIFFMLLVICLASCVREKKLPVLGEKDFDGRDTVYHTIPEFTFINQDSAVVSNETFKNKIYVADFFFTTCPSICPIMKTQMKRVYDEFLNDDEVMMLSHTIDPEHDTVALLKDYSERLGASGNKWHFVTGEMEQIYRIAQKGYFVTTAVDNTVPGGFLHSGAFLLIDKQRRIRGQYDGTKEDQVDRLIDDIKRLKEEDENN
jgi:protein SCO1/2